MRRLNTTPLLLSSSCLCRRKRWLDLDFLNIHFPRPDSQFVKPCRAEKKRKNRYYIVHHMYLDSRTLSKYRASKNSSRSVIGLWNKRPLNISNDIKLILNDQGVPHQHLVTCQELCFGKRCFEATLILLVSRVSKKKCS